jgi:U3 small nucleolar RNA-associated protein 5
LHAQNKKKRKRTTNKDKYGVVAYGTIDSEICMFAPAEAKVVGKLRGPHERGVKDFRFAGEDCLAGWSIGGKLVLWDLGTDRAIR